ncbi:hypothetical protein HK097_006863, partial [Rhizophlyctis rosea]
MQQAQHSSNSLAAAAEYPHSNQQQQQPYPQPQTATLARPEYHLHHQTQLYTSVPSLSTIPPNPFTLQPSPSSPMYPKIATACVKTIWEPTLGIEAKGMLSKGSFLQRSTSSIGLLGKSGGESSWKFCVVKVQPGTRTLAVFRGDKRGGGRGGEGVGMVVGDPEMAGQHPLQTYNLRHATVEKAANVPRAKAFRVRLMNG